MSNKKHDPLIPSAASHWTKATLDALNASYDRHNVTSFDFSDIEIPSPLKDGTLLASFSPFLVNKYCVDVDTLVNAMLSVNNSERITPEFGFTASSHPALIHFGPFYQKLRLVLSRDAAPDQIRRETSPGSTPPPQLASPPSATDPSTPPPSANPVDPQYSSGSFATASSGVESKEESVTDAFTNAFLSGCYFSFPDSLRRVSWFHETEYTLEHEYATSNLYWLTVESTKKCMQN